MIKRLVFVIWVALSFVFILLGCARTGNATSSVSDTSSTIESQLAGGAPIYNQTCATNTCHGANGEGIRSGNGFKVWPLVGPDFQSRHPNAEIAFDVVRSGDEPNLRALTDQQIFDAIAYQLSQNQITLESPLTAANAFTTNGGAMSGIAQSGLFPPSDNIVIRTMPPTRDLPLSAENDRLRLQIDQIAEASSIGNAKLPSDGAFLILVFVLSDLDQAPIKVSPENLSLSTPTDGILLPQSINLHSAIEQFHTQTIEPQYGTAALVIFTLSSPDQFDQLIYDDQAGNHLTLALKP